MDKQKIVLDLKQKLSQLSSQDISYLNGLVNACLLKEKSVSSTKK